MTNRLLKNIVKEALVKYPITRSDDKKLFWTVCEIVAGHSLPSIQYHWFMSLPIVPSSIDRARREIQREYPELQADEQVKLYRKQRQETKGDFINSLLV